MRFFYISSANETLCMAIMVKITGGNIGGSRMLHMYEKKAALTGSGYERLDKCVTENSARTLQRAAASEKFPCIPAEINFANCETIIAKEYFYHRSCCRKIMIRKKEVDQSKNIADIAYSKLLREVKENMINNCEVLRMPDISRLYCEIVEELTDGEECPRD